MLIGILILVWIAIMGGLIARNLFRGARGAARAINSTEFAFGIWYWIATLVFCGLLALFLHR